jgi:hypothetical protein
MTSDAASWRATLDQLEADLIATEDAFDNGDREPQRSVATMSSVEFPAGPVPPELAPRAEALLRRTRRLEARASAEIDGIRDALRSLAGHRPPAPSRAGSIVDVDA